jgi:NDP-sugar pyrophosphorylase family protein
MKLTTALILAGGKGERMRPITYEIPKPMLPVQGKPILAHQIEVLKKNGIDRVILSLGYLQKKISSHFGYGSKFGVRIDYVVESKPLGTAGPIRLAKKYLKDSFAAMNGDTLIDIDLQALYEFHRKQRTPATIALVKAEKASASGLVGLRDGKIESFTEKPKSGSGLINAGVYVFEPEIVRHIPRGRSMLEKDVFPKLAGRGLLSGMVVNAKMFDVGTLEGYAKAIKGWK